MIRFDCDALMDVSSRRYDLSEQQFRSGAVGYLNTLDAQWTLYAAQQALVSARLSRLSNLVTLYTSLGGGWSEHTRRPVGLPVTGVIYNASAPTEAPLVADNTRNVVRPASPRK